MELVTLVARMLKIPVTVKSKVKAIKYGYKTMVVVVVVMVPSPSSLLFMAENTLAESGTNHR